jgi:polyferredoxin
MPWRVPDRKHASRTVARYHPGMRITLVVIGLMLVLAGLVWMAQGLDLPFAPRSFMTSDRAWLIIGAITALAGAVIVGWVRRQGATG